LPEEERKENTAGGKDLLYPHFLLPAKITKHQTVNPKNTKGLNPTEQNRTT
jgi:hypothetical protein